MSDGVDIARTIRQERPFDSVQTEVLMTLIRATDRVTERANAPLRARGLTVPQYNVLRILRGSPDGLQTHQVVDRLVTRAPNITRVVDKLERKGLLTRCRSRSDRRVIGLRITPAGLRLLAELDEPMAASIREAMGGLDESELRELCVRLNRLRRPLETEPSGRQAAAPPPRKDLPS